jgi:hypothetical protein
MSTTSSTTSTSSSTTTTTTLPIEIFVTTDDIKNYLGDMDEISSSEETLLQQMIDSVQALFEAYINRKLARDVFVEIHDGEYSDKLFPNNVPVSSIQSIHQSIDRTWDSTTLMPTTEYTIAHNTYIQLFTRTLNYPQSVRVVYTAGYTTDTYPPDLKQATIEQVAYKFTHEYTGRNLGISARTYQDGTLAYRPGTILPGVTVVLNRYRKMNLG